MSTRPHLTALFLVLIFPLAFASCATVAPTWRTTSAGNAIRWCEGRGQHVTYTVDPCVPYHRIPAVRQAFDFWNNVLGRELFVPSNVGQIVVTCATAGELGPDRWAHIDGVFSIDGCEAAVVIKTVAGNGDNSFWVEVFKHEIGHSLGLLDNSASVVMAPSFVEWPLDGRGLTDAERAEITKRYLLP